MDELPLTRSDARRPVRRLDVRAVAGTIRFLIVLGLIAGVLNVLGWM
jgi:hypothetical protein